MAEIGEKLIEAEFERYRTALISYILKFVTVREDAEDICQRTYEKAFVNIGKYDPTYAFSTWLFNIAKNQAIDHLRRHRCSISAVSISDDKEALSLSEGVTPEEQLIVNQAVKEMIENIKQLPEKYSQVAEMRFIRDYAYEDIAAELGITLGAVKTRINRARKLLSQTRNNGTSD